MRGGLLNAAGVVALLACGAAASAETLRGALVETYKTNPTLNAERANVRTIDEGVAIARAQGRPQLSGNVGLNQNVLSTNTTGGRTLSAGIDVSYTLFNGGRVRNSVRAANERVLAGRATLLATEGDVFTQAVGAYMDVIRDRTIVTLNENEVKVLETNLQATRDRFEVGDLTRTDVAQSEARLALARSNLATAQGRLHGSEETYRQVIGNLPGDLDPPDPLPPLPTNPDQAVDIALDRNPDLAAISAQARAAGLDVSVARAARLPAISAVSSANHFDFLGTANQQFGAPAGVNLPQTQSTAAIGLTARIPIYQGGLVGAQVRQAQSVQSQLLEQGVQIERQVVANVRAAFASYVAAQQSIAANQVAVSANTLALEGARAEQSVGTRTVLDVLNAEQELLNSQVALVTARHDAYVAGFSLLNAMGEAESRNLNLDGGALYDPVANYRRVARNMNDWTQDPTPRAVSTRTAPPGTPAPGERPETDVTAPPR
ncbi:MAG TPA: TolC family outer membrane protein [Allosphingosinicella sp.]|jgi:outer membrane protein|nr:TolC family outer membrane protein [Allosphingosinicella sp.]